METTLEKAIVGLITVFHTYSGKEGDKFKLSKAELKNLLKGELPGLLDGHQDCAVVKEILTGLDKNRDGQVDFQEYVVLVIRLVFACHEFFKEAACK